MSFGFSVADFLAAIELCRKVRKEFVSAPKEFKDLSDDIRSLGIVLQDIEASVPESGLDVSQREALNEAGRGCRNVLQDIENHLQRYSALGPSDTGSSHGNWFQKTLQRWKWKPEEVREFRERIASNMVVLNAFLWNASSRVILAVRDGVDRLNQHQDDQEREAILDWLSPIDYTAKQQDVGSRRERGTGRWVLGSIPFREWLAVPGRALLFWGLPGAGKTTLTSLVVDELTARYRDDSGVAVAQIYLDYKDTGNQTVELVLASLLRQLVSCRPNIPEDIRDAYQQNERGRSRLGFGELCRHLKAVASLYSRVFVVVDALDECPADDGRRYRLLEEMMRLSADSPASVSLLGTSRPFADITDQFEEHLSLEIRATDEDVHTYLDGQMRKLPGLATRSEELRQQIKREIANAVDGIFLLAQLLLQSLSGKRSTAALKRALCNLPKGTDKLDAMYEDAMRRVEAQSADMAELAKDVLSYIIVAASPLSILELQYILAVEDGSAELDKDNITDVKDIIDSCCGLVIFDAESRTIRVMHLTAQAYLDRTRSRWFPMADTKMANSCLTYLSFSTFRRRPDESHLKFRTRCLACPFYLHAAMHWGTYARRVRDAGQPSMCWQILAFFESVLSGATWSHPIGRVLDATRSRIRPTRANQGSCSKYVLGLHLAASFNLDDVIAEINPGMNIDSRDKDPGRTALFVAAQRGCDDAVRALLRRGADAILKDSDHRTALFEAAAGGHESTVELLHRAGGSNASLINSRAWNGWTALSEAASGGHVAVVEFLLSVPDVDPNLPLDEPEDIFPSMLPLWMAARHGHNKIVKLLLRAGADVEAPARDSMTALSYASEGGHEPVVETLLGTPGVNPDSGAATWGLYEGRKPLSLAAEAGSAGVVRLLLATGKVDPDYRPLTGYNQGMPPLYFAVGGCHVPVAELLLRTGKVSVDDKWPLVRVDRDYSGAPILTRIPNEEFQPTMRPVELAKSIGFAPMVDLLIANGAAVDPSSVQGEIAELTDDGTVVPMRLS